SERSLLRWFDTGAFAQPAQYLFGNQGIGHIRGPGLTNVNGSILRKFSLTETKQLQFRCDMFNAPNHPNFGTPGAIYEGAGFGIINSAAPARQLQLGLKLTF